jgi:tetratricopeptide (TPR) repeat protein
MFNQRCLERELDDCHQLISHDPKNFHAYIRRGMAHFKLLEIEESIQDFDEAEKLNPSLTPYLWQRGLSYYYAERFHEGALQFDIDLTVNAYDVEETVWHYLCMAQSEGITEAKKTLLRVGNDPRPIMRAIYQFYAGNCTAKQVLGFAQQVGKEALFYSYLYLGLHAEVTQDIETAQKYIVTAVNDYALNNYMWYLARVHTILRNWS